jgi:hypothetical protein
VPDDDTISIVGEEVALLESNADETDGVGLIGKTVLDEGSTWLVADVSIKIELVSDKIGEIDDDVGVGEAVKDDRVTELELVGTMKPLGLKVCSTAPGGALNEESDDEAWTDDVDNGTDDEVWISELDEDSEDNTTDKMAVDVMTLDFGRAIELTSEADVEVECQRDCDGDDEGPLLDGTGLPHRPYPD